MKARKNLLFISLLGVMQSQGAVSLLEYGIPDTPNIPVGKTPKDPTFQSGFVSGTPIDDNNGTVSGANFSVSSTSGSAFARQTTSSDTGIATLTATSLADSITRGVYLEFTATVLADTADLTSLDFRHFSQDLTSGSNTDFESNLAVFTSFDGFATAPVDGGQLFTSTLNTLGTASRSVDLTTGAYDGLATNTEISFRFYQYSPDGTLFLQVSRLDDIVLNGNAVPEPSAALLGLVGLSGMMLRRKR